MFCMFTWNILITPCICIWSVDSYFVKTVTTQNGSENPQDSTLKYNTSTMRLRMLLVVVLCLYLHIVKSHKGISHSNLFTIELRFNLLSSNVNSRHDDIVTSDVACIASYRKKQWKVEKICNKMLYHTLCFG